MKMAEGLWKLYIYGGGILKNKSYGQTKIETDLS